MAYRRMFNGKVYKRIACFRWKFMAEGYAGNLRHQKTAYLDIKVGRSGRWWCVYGQEQA